MKFRKPWWVDEQLEYWSRVFILSGVWGTIMVVALILGDDPQFIRDDADPMISLYLTLATLGLGIVLRIVLCVIGDPYCPNQWDDGIE